MGLTSILCIGFFSSAALGADDVVSSTRMSVVEPSSQIRESGRSISLGLLQSQFFTPTTESFQRDAYSDLRLGIRLGDEGENSVTRVNVGGLFSLNQTGDNHVFAPELFYAHKFLGDRVRLTVGRQLFPWSWLDNHFGLGMWQPQFRWDPLRPEAQGLTGAFLHWNDGLFQLMGYVSPFFVPDQGAQMTVQRGQIQSANRWFDLPPSELNMGSGRSEIRYEVVRPQVGEVVSQFSSGLWGRWGRIESGPWIQGSWSRKPNNSFALPFDGHMNVGLNSSFETPARVYPRVYHHQIATVETGWAEEAWDVRASWTRDAPEELQIPVGWQRPSLGQMQVMGLQASRKFWLWGLPVQRLSATYLRADEQRQVQNSPLMTSVDVLRGRSYLQHVVQVGWRGELDGRHRNRWTAGLDYTHSLGIDGNWFSGRMEFAPTRSWVWHVRFDVLGSDSQNNSGFYARNRANDRIQGGFTYVF